LTATAKDPECCFRGTGYARPPLLKAAGPVFKFWFDRTRSKSLRCIGSPTVRALNRLLLVLQLRLVMFILNLAASNRVVAIPDGCRHCQFALAQAVGLSGF